MLLSLSNERFKWVWLENHKTLCMWHLRFSQWRRWWPSSSTM
jgi:hypothetical protein